MYSKSIKTITFIGSTLALLLRTFRYFPRVGFRWQAVRRELWIVGAQSLPLACFFLFLIGMVFALQTGMQMRDFGQEEWVGRLVAGGMARELGPLMTAIILIARNGSSTAAEIGTMAVSEEVSALRMMSIDPADFIVMPRLFAFLIMGPVIAVLATAVGILGGLPVAHFQLQVPPRVYMESVLLGLEPAMVIYWGVLRSLVFSTITVIVACSFGLKAWGGALGVGQASRESVVWSLLMVVFFNYILTSFYLLAVNLAGGE